MVRWLWTGARACAFMGSWRGCLATAGPACADGAPTRARCRPHGLHLSVGIRRLSIGGVGGEEVKLVHLLHGRRRLVEVELLLRQHLPKQGKATRSQAKQRRRRRTRRGVRCRRQVLNCFQRFRCRAHTTCGHTSTFAPMHTQQPPQRAANHRNALNTHQVALDPGGFWVRRGLDVELALLDGGGGEHGRAAALASRSARLCPEHRLHSHVQTHLSAAVWLLRCYWCVLVVALLLCVVLRCSVVVA